MGFRFAISREFRMKTKLVPTSITQIRRDISPSNYLRMPGRCSVPLCDNQVGGFTFPRCTEQREKWIHAVKRLTLDKKPWQPSKHDVVCRSHFLDSDLLPQKPYGQGRRRLKPRVVPSIFPFKKPLTGCQTARKVRADARNVKVENKKEVGPAMEHTEHPVDSLDVGRNEVIEIENVPENNDSDRETTGPQDAGSMCSILSSNGGYRIERYIADNKAFKYLTGFDSYEHFKLLMAILGPACYELNYKSKLDVEDELFLTLIKLRHAKDDYGLGLDFGVGRKVVGRITKTWINFMYFELSELNFWPEREAIDEHFPTRFQHMFPSTRVILDATEVPIQRPRNCNGQRITFSSYKNTNTLKTMIGISPRGIVSFVSDSYGGSASDRQIIERSELLNGGLLLPGDSIMADRGIMVQDLFAHQNIKVNTPTTMKGRTQHDATTVVHDRRIASKRIHVERVIGYAKTFKILKKCLKSEKIRMGSRITKVCFWLTNFRGSIIGKRA